MKNEEDSLTDEDTNRNIYNLYTLKDIENNRIKQLPTLPLYDYPETNTGTLSPACYNMVQKTRVKARTVSWRDAVLYILYIYRDISTSQIVQLDN